MRCSVTSAVSSGFARRRVDEIAAVKGLNRDLAAEIRRHLDEMTALLDVEEVSDAADQISLPLEPPAIPTDKTDAPVNDAPVRN